MPDPDVPPSVDLAEHPAGPLAREDPASSPRAMREALARAAEPTPTGAASTVQRVLMLVAAAVIVIALYIGKPILLPLALSTLLSFLLSPACVWLERRHFPRVLAVVTVVAAALLVAAAIGWAVYSGAQQLVADFDRYRTRILATMDQLPFATSGEGGAVEEVRKTIDEVGRKLEGEDPEAEEGLLNGAVVGPARLFDRRGEDPGEPLYVQEVVRPQTAPERLGYIIATAAGPVGIAGLTFIFLFFTLLQRDDLRDRVIKVGAGTQVNIATQALDDAARRIGRYLRAQCIVNGTYGLAVGIGLNLISFAFAGETFPSVWLWALLCALLRFIPYLGPWIAASFPLLVSIGHYDGYQIFVATAIFFIIIELLSNNIMEPMMYGPSVGMSELAVIMSAAFWTFVWGPVGLLVATPLTTCLVVLGKYVPALSTFDILLGKEPVLEPHTRVYQRLLALDAEDAEDVAEQFREDHSLTETFDRVLLPALAMAEHDRHAGRLDDRRAEFVCTAAREIVDSLARQAAALPADSVDFTDEGTVAVDERFRRVRVVLLPAADDADETVGMMLKALLDRRGLAVTVVEDTMLASEKSLMVSKLDADVVVVSALPPRAVARVRYLVKRLQQTGAELVSGGERKRPVPIVVGLWMVVSDTERAEARIAGELAGAPGGKATPGSAEARVKVVQTLSAAVEAVRQLAEVAVSSRSAAASTGNVASPARPDTRGRESDTAGGSTGRPRPRPV